MAKKDQNKKPNKPNKQRKKGRGKFDAIDIIALIIFISIGVGIVGGTIWYYAFHQPRAAAEMEEVTIGITEAFFDFHYDTISMGDITPYLSSNRARSFNISMPGQIQGYQQRQVISRIESDIEVEILERGWNTGRARAIFWQYEEDNQRPSRTFLTFYDYEFVYEDGQWLVERIIAPSVRQLEDLRRERGVLEEHQEQEEEAGDTDQDDE